MLKTLGAQVKQYRWVTFITPVFFCAGGRS